MDYKEKYEQALERAKGLLEGMDEGDYFASSGDIENIFPELQEQESEDERIRKELIEQILYITPNVDELDDELNTLPSYQERINKYRVWLEKQGENKPAEDEKIKQEIVAYINELADLKNEKIPTKWLAWLEKQGEHKPFDYENATIQQKDFAPKVEPKFKVGDWITNGRYVRLVVGVDSRHYQFKDGDAKYIDDIDKKYHLWTIEDAKDGDVLTNGKIIVIFKQIVEPKYKQHIEAYIGLDLGCDIQVTSESWSLGIDKAMPATKEQRDMLFQQMKEAGYEWDAEKKELKKIEPKKLDANKVIAWLVANICDFEYYVKLFKKDFGLTEKGGKK